MFEIKEKQRVLPESTAGSAESKPHAVSVRRTVWSLRNMSLRKLRLLPPRK